MISIIIPMLNEEDYLPHLFKTLDAQKHIGELIFADGFSSDKSVELVEKYSTHSKFPVKILKLPKAGLAYQKNEAVRIAQFEQLLFLDVDVILPENFLEQCLLQIKTRQIQLAGTRIYSAEKTLKFKFIFWYYTHFYLFILRLFKPVVNGCSMFSTRTLHHQIGGFMDGVTFEDFLYAEMGSQFGKVYILKDVYVETSARRFYNLSFFEFIELIFSGFYNFFKSSGPNHEQMKGFRAKYGNHEKPKYPM